MSAPSFSSFPPSFSSFPDLDPGPSKRAATPTEESADAKKRKKKKERDEKERRQRNRRDEKKYRGSLERDSGRSWKHEEERAHTSLDDEHLKAREDSSIRAERLHASEAYKEQLPYYTDRKGDPLNVQYGGLHAGSVPRYHPVSGESSDGFSGEV